MPAASPLCFILMPFGVKQDPAGGQPIDFDTIYETAIRPAVVAAGMEPIRADEERTGGIIHKPMFERLMLCDYAVADLSTGNANVFYELGVRHAARPSTTLAIFASRQRLPFDVDYLRAIPYELGPGNRFGQDEASSLEIALSARLKELKASSVEDAVVDSPVFQLLEGYQAPDIKRLKTDVFRERARYTAQIQNELARARDAGDIAGIEAIRATLGPIEDIEFGVLIDLYLSYRAVEGWSAMLELHASMPDVLKRTVMVREQLGFAYNRLGLRDDALRTLEGVLDDQGPNSETCGLIGRIYKDLWNDARERGDEFLAEGYLDRAIEFYTNGFEADLRDAYPGVNAVTLLEIKGDEEALELQARLLPVVRFAVERRLESTRPDYWDHATLLELAVLAEDRKAARKCLTATLAHVREVWEPKTTANNLGLIREARRERKVEVSWIDHVIEALENSAAGPEAP